MTKLVRLGLFCASLALAMLVLPASVQAQYTFVTNTDNTITITGYTGAEDAIRIPDTINDLTVSCIGDSAFYGCVNLGNVTIPASVTRVEDSAFADCTSLSNVFFKGNAPKLVGWWWFDDDPAIIYYLPGTTGWGWYFGNVQTSAWPCPGFSYTVANGTCTITGYTGPGGDVTIPSVIADLPVTSIEDFAFFFCASLTNVTIGANVTSIGDDAFSDCTNLVNITIDSNVRSIGAYAFASCICLTSVALPSNVTTIGKGAFAWCTNLAAITVDPANPIYSSLDGALFDENRTQLIAYPGGNTGSYTVPTSVTSIAILALAGSSLTNVVIGPDVAAIGGNPFAFSDSLKAILVDPSSPFLTSVDGVLFDKRQTTIIACPRSTVGLYTIPNTVTTIGDYAFAECVDLTAIAMPNSVTCIGDFAFYVCHRLANITIPEHVTHIGMSAFMECQSLTDLTLPDSVTELGEVAFECCVSLTNITLGANISSIELATFNICYKLTSVTIPASVTNIGDDAFAQCPCLTGLYFEGNAPSLSSWAFEETSVTVYYLPGTTGWGATYGGQPTAPWSFPDFNYVVQDDGIALTKYTGPGGDVTIPSTFAGRPVTCIADRTFFLCFSLTSVSLPDSLTSIGDYAFVGCTSLTNAIIPDGVTNIGDNAFAGCTALTAITTSSNNPSYSSADGVLYDKNQTTVIQCPAGKAGDYEIPNTVNCIADTAFAECSSLTSVTIPSNVTSIGNAAFYDCSSLTDLHFMGNAPSFIGWDWADGDPAIVYYLPETTGWGSFLSEHPTVPVGYAWSDNGDGTCTITGYSGNGGNVTIPITIDGLLVSSIGNGAFSNCTNLVRVRMPNSMTCIGDSAFAGCPDLVSVYFHGNAPTLGSTVFGEDSQATVYYLPETAGWDSFDYGHALPWNPHVRHDADFGVRANGFGFTFTNAGNPTVVIEACTDLTGNNWTPVATNTLMDGSSYFSDPGWMNYPARFYRFRMP